MAWTYAQLAAAYNALSPVPASLAAACDIFKAQNTTLTGQPIAVAGAFGVLETSTDGEWAKVVLRSRGTLSGASPPTAADLAVSAAIEAVALFETAGAVITAAEWPLAQSWLSDLEAVGDVSAGSISAIAALATVVVPTWQPAVTPGDLQTAGV